MSTALLHTDGLHRCPWPGKDDALYVAYHDQEWGVPEYDDRALYEKLMLDGFQAGLSWITILRKRENFRKAFDGFAPEKIARYTPKKKERLMQDAGIVRNRAKIEGAVLSARSYLDIMEKGSGFSALLWDFVDGKPKVNHFRSTAQVPRSDRAVAENVEGVAGARLQVRRPDDRLCLHAGGRHGQRPSGDVPSPRSSAEARQAQVSGASFDAAQIDIPVPDPWRTRLAAHAVGAPARSARPLPARRRDGGHRARPRARRALERADRGRAHLLRRPALPAGRGAGARARARGSIARGG